MTLREIKRKVSESDKELAIELRDLADKLESGDVSEFVVVANLNTEGEFIRMANFDNAWKLLGAIEYAKQTVHRGMDCD